ncbi:MAG: phosphatidate cytidylyltransferase [Microthrixaceae bacterium]|nr:phosphatidate cytidylyltransferase [Acidimicrobiales bacterium]MCB9403390.1 phosphatidate cytidylyltransferase [Microthrixaceae bacterium]
MDDQHRPHADDNLPTEPGEGVRIIGADEAADYVERGDVVERRGDDQKRFGDRPAAPPVGPRPALRFPLDANSDLTRIERPPVQPAPEPVTGPVEMPHWTEPPTGEVPAVLIGDDSPLIEDGDELDAWSSFATSTPRWRDADDDWEDDGFMERLATDSEQVRIGALADSASPLDFEDLEAEVEERRADNAASARDDDDWSASVGTYDEEDGSVWEDDEWSSGSVDQPEPLPGAGSSGTESDSPGAGTRVAAAARTTRSAGGGGGGGDRDMGSAVVVGAGLGVVALVLLIAFPTGMAWLVAAAIGLAAGEYFGVLRKVGWEAATPLGLAACALLPLAVYWRGPVAYPLVGFVLVAAVLTWYVVGAGGPDPRVLEGSGATLLGAAWIGGLGATATAMLRIPDDGRWLLLVAILATVAYDVGGLFIGRSMGHRPLSVASPNKTIEGLLGGMGCAFVATLVCVAIFGLGVETGAGAGILLGLGAAVAAPLGDLCQSQLKRDLGVKDMGAMLPGHGGVLDRIDGMLFVIPMMYWLTISLAG